MKFIIFGGKGFIGSHYREYIETNDLGKVICFDLKDGETCDVRKEIELDDQFSKDDIIINLAAIHTTPGHLDFEYFETNIKGAESVCAFAEKHGIQNIIFTSSIAPYGASEEFKNEITLPTPNTPYGVSKLVAEKIHQIWLAKDEKNRKLLILRPGVVFGKGEGGNYTRLYQALKKGLFFYPGRKDTSKACIYVKDLVQVSLELLGNEYLDSELYNFCYAESPRIDRIVKEICTITKIREPKLLINGKLMMLAASILGILGGKKFGIHPQRIRKLMISTNISGEKLSKTNCEFKYGLRGGIADWYKDCAEEGLF